MGAQNRNVDAVVAEILANRGLRFTVLDDGRYAIDRDAGPMSISLDNIRRTFERDGDEAAVARFIDDVLGMQDEPLLEWSAAQSGLFPYLESSEVEIGADTLVNRSSDKTVVLLTHFAEAQGRVRFIRDVDLAKWGVTAEQAWERAFRNLNELARTTTVQFLDANGFTLGVLEAHEPYKASLILARELRPKVESELGWPVFAVAPARDFVYLISKSAQSELGRVGAVVVREYQQSGYPISTEVWELSDSGVSAFGEFPVGGSGS